MPAAADLSFWIGVKFLNFSCYWSLLYCYFSKNMQYKINYNVVENKTKKAYNEGNFNNE